MLYSYFRAHRMSGGPEILTLKLGVAQSRVRSH